MERGKKESRKWAEVEDYSSLPVALPGVGGGGRVIKDTTYLMNLTDKILLAFKFELTQKYSVSKSQHC